MLPDQLERPDEAPLGSKNDLENGYAEALRRER